MLPVPSLLLHSRSPLFLAGLLVLGTALLLAPAPANGQAGHWGAKGGITFMTGGGEGLGEVGHRTGFVVGATRQISVAGRLSLRPELLYVRKGWTTTGRIPEGKYTTTITLDYLELPVLANVRLMSAGGLSAHAIAGPTVGVRVHNGTKVEGAIEGTGSYGSIDRTEVGLAAGAGVNTEIDGQPVRLDVRYRRSLSNINEGSRISYRGERGSPPFIRHQGVSVEVGLAF